MATLAVAKTVQRRGYGFTLLTAVLGGIIGFFLGIKIGVLLSPSIDSANSGTLTNGELILGYVLAIVGYLGGLGFFNYPIRWLLGRPEPTHEEMLREKGASEGASRYFRLTLDHKVIAIQYLVVVLTMFCVAGFNALLIRLELINPNQQFFGPDTYLTLVGLHGGMMVFLGSSAVVGPLGNFLIPLMIGAKDMAYPRLEALGMWLLPLSGVFVMTSIFFGGFSTGWTGYAPLADNNHLGIDGYEIGFILVGAGMCISAINMLATVLKNRAPGMTWTRLPTMIWAITVVSILQWLAAPILVAVLLMVCVDRTFQTGIFIAAQGGSAYLYENLFWTFAHPEVYIFALPAFGVVTELLPVFTRKPLFGYKAGIVAMFGIGLLSWFVWQHHLFVSGLTPTLRPFFVFSTEMISFPTGIVFLNMMGTLYRSKIKFTVPMMFALAFFPNFLFGGFTGVFLSDVPTDVQLHGSYMVQAHFHFILMGGTLFALFGCVYYWFPKFTGRMMNDTLGKIHFWLMWPGVLGTFIALATAGAMGMPRRVPWYMADLQLPNDIATVFAYLMGISMLFFLYNLVTSWVWGKPAPENPWGSRTLEWMTPNPIPVDNFEEIPLVVSGPYDYGVEGVGPMAILNPSKARAAGALS